MSERRSGRAQTKVDYSKFTIDADFEDEDDFSSPSLANKKSTHKDAKSSKKEKKKKKMKISSDEEDDFKPSKLKKKDRPGMSEKDFDRDLELALEISKRETVKKSKEESDSKMTETGVKDNKVEDKEVKENTDEVNVEGEKEVDDSEAMEEEEKPKTRKSPRKKTQKKKEPEVDLDKIEVLEENISLEDTTTVGGRKKRRAAMKVTNFNEDVYDLKERSHRKRKKLDNDEFHEFADDDSELLSDDLEDIGDESDDDIDFIDTWSGKKKGRGRGRGRGKSHVATASPARPKPKPRLSATVIPVNKGRGRSGFKPPKPNNHLIGLEHTPKPLMSNGKLVIRKPTWASGDRSPLGGVTVKSPGGIRLGLSKKVKVKSLHSQVKLST